MLVDFYNNNFKGFYQYQNILIDSVSTKTSYRFLTVTTKTPIFLHSMNLHKESVPTAYFK